MTVLYFKKWLQYDHQVNIKILDLIKKIPVFDATQSLSHILVAQKLWLSRIQNTSFDFSLFDKKFDVIELETLLNDQYLNIKEYLDSIQNQDLSSKIIFKNKNNKVCQYAVYEILTHVFNHGTHHRAQILLILKPQSPDLPILDFIHNLN